MVLRTAKNSRFEAHQTPAHKNLAMAKFYKIRLNSIYLTSDGTNTGDPVKLSVSGADALGGVSGVTIPTVGGAVNQLFGTSKPIEIRVLTHISEALWNSLVALINTALENSETINLIGTGDTGDFQRNVQPLLPKPFEAQDFRNGRILTPIFRFITV